MSIPYEPTALMRQIDDRIWSAQLLAEDAARELLKAINYASSFAQPDQYSLRRQFLAEQQLASALNVLREARLMAQREEQKSK